MVIAALISFGALLVAWALAPSEPAPEVTQLTTEPEPIPLAA